MPLLGSGLFRMQTFICTEAICVVSGKQWFTNVMPPYFWPEYSVGAVQQLPLVSLHCGLHEPPVVQHWPQSISQLEQVSPLPQTPLPQAAAPVVTNFCVAFASPSWSAFVSGPRQ